MERVIRRGRARQGVIERSDSLLHSAQPAEYPTHTVVRVGVSWVVLNSGTEMGQRLLVAAGRVQQLPRTHVQVRVLGHEGQRRTYVRRGFAQPRAPSEARLRCALEQVFRSQPLRHASAGL